jgi:hypothetical protein
MKFPNLKFNVYSLCISALFLGSYQTSAMAFTLDLFSDVESGSSQKVTLDPDNSQFTGSDTDILPGTALGERRLDLTISPTSLGLASLKVSNNKASISSEADTTISSAKFTWGSDSTTPQDITDVGTDNSFQLNVLTIDLVQGATFTFTVEDSDGDVGEMSQNITSVGDTYFPYQNLTNSSNVNKAAIRQISLDITNAPESFDATFDYIQSAQQVPFDFSPSLGLVCCGGLFGLNKLRKRLQSSQY